MVSQKRLYRDDREFVFSGVCKGLADYFGIDVSLVRIIAVIALLMSFGSALIAYLVIFAIVPTKTSLINKGEIIDDHKIDPKDDYTINPDDYEL